MTTDNKTDNKDDRDEEMLNVPVDKATKAALQQRAKSHDRATCREASVILKNAVKGDNATKEGGAE